MRTLVLTATALAVFGAAPAQATQAAIGLSFEGISQYDFNVSVLPGAAGAVGASQFVEFVNGGFGVYSKATGASQKLISDDAFWVAAGQQRTFGTPRVLYDKPSNRWIALAYGNIAPGFQLPDVLIAVSNTSDAAGTWQSTKLTAFAGGTADYPTLAIDRNAVYIGNDNYAASGEFAGTTLNVIPIASLINNAAPTIAGLKQFVTPYSVGPGNLDRGYTIQGVNSQSAGTTGKVVAASLLKPAVQRYDVLDAGTPGATETAIVQLGAAFKDNGLARQPAAAVPANRRNIETGDGRIWASVWEVNDRIYSIRTVTPTGGTHTVLRYDVIDSATDALLDEGDIGDANYDFYAGSLAVNAAGKVVIGFNRSGLDAATGKISLFARSFDTDGAGKLVATSGDLLLHVSNTDNYHNVGLEGAPTPGRQRWDTYGAVTVDPLDDNSFWVTGEFAREYATAANGHPGSNGGARWGTWIAQIVLPAPGVPEPGTWATMIVGLGLVGATARRRRLTRARLGVQDQSSSALYTIVRTSRRTG